MQLALALVLRARARAKFHLANPDSIAGNPLLARISVAWLCFISCSLLWVENAEQEYIELIEVWLYYFLKFCPLTIVYCFRSLLWLSRYLVILGYSRSGQIFKLNFNSEAVCPIKKSTGYLGNGSIDCNYKVRLPLH